MSAKAKASKKEIGLNFFYSMGAAVVILGALCKVNHYTLFGIDGSLVLALGMVVEIIVFVVFAFDVPEGDYKWERAFPELGSEDAVKVSPKKQGVATSVDSSSLSGKLDDMLKEARLDAALFERLRDGIENFGQAVGEINKTTNAAAATQKYGSQLEQAANNMESLNSLYQLQLNSGQKQVELNQKFIQEMEASAGSSKQFVTEMQSLTNNIGNLNKVYGGMLSAMKINQ